MGYLAVLIGLALIAAGCGTVQPRMCPHPYTGVSLTARSELVTADMPPFVNLVVHNPGPRVAKVVLRCKQPGMAAYDVSLVVPGYSEQDVALQVVRPRRPLWTSLACEIL